MHALNLKKTLANEHSIVVVINIIKINLFILKLTHSKTPYPTLNIIMSIDYVLILLCAYILISIDHINVCKYFKL